MNAIKDVDTEYNAYLLTQRIIGEVHNANSPLRKYLDNAGISSDAFLDILELGLDAVRIRELLFGRLRNHYIMCEE